MYLMHGLGEKIVSKVHHIEINFGEAPPVKEEKKVEEVKVGPTDEEMKSLYHVCTNEKANCQCSMWKTDVKG